MTNYELYTPKLLLKAALTDQLMKSLPFITLANGNLPKQPYFYKVSDKQGISRK